MMISIKIISWNVRGLNYPIKRGNVKWVIRRFSYDVAILLESKLQEISRHITLSHGRRRSFGWPFRPFVGCFGAVIIWNSQVLELMDS